MERVSDVVKGVYLLHPFCVRGKAEQLPGILGSGAEPRSAINVTFGDLSLGGNQVQYL